MARRRPGGITRNLSIATRVALLIVLVAIVSLAITAAIGLQRGSDLVDEVLRERLETVAASRGDEVERAMRGLRSRALALAASPATAEAIAAFSAATAELDEPPVTPEIEDRVTQYYADVVAPHLEEVRGTPVSLPSLIPATDAALRLQDAWVAVDDDVDDPALVDDVGDGTTWSAVHAALHPAYRQIVQAGGFTDLQFVSASDERIVYTVDKGIDLGTSLAVGPHSGGVLASLVAEIRRDPRPGTALVGDFSRPSATGDRPVGVVASPVFLDGQFEGVVALQFDATELTAIMTDDGDWSQFGDTAQAYVISSDGTMRSDARGFIEDPAEYLASPTSSLTDDQARAMAALDTTVVFNPVDPQLVTSVGAADAATINARSPIGLEVVAAHRALDIDGLSWTAVAEVGRTEVNAPLRGYARDLLIAMAVFVVLVTFLAVAWATRLVAPLRIVSQRLRTARQRGTAIGDEASEELRPSAPKEFLDLASDIDVMLERLDQRQRDIDRRTAERMALLRQFLPTRVLRRAEAGEQDVIDQADNATVAVIVIRGLGDLVRESARDHARDLLDLVVDELDDIAQRHGLERIRLSGDAYHAVAGASRPVLDHAPRAVAFALDVRTAIEHLVDDADAPLATSAGIASGRVVLGLTSGARLVYDGWGPAVDRATELARTAAVHEVLVDVDVRSHLPAGFSVGDEPARHDERAVAVIGMAAPTGGGT